MTPEQVDTLRNWMGFAIWCILWGLIVLFLSGGCAGAQASIVNKTERDFDRHAIQWAVGRLDLHDVEVVILPTWSDEICMREEAAGCRYGSTIVVKPNEALMVPECLTQTDLMHELLHIWVEAHGIEDEPLHSSPIWHMEQGLNNELREVDSNCEVFR